MKINLEKIKYKNILSVGNDGIEVDLNTHHSTILSGSNGSSKSTLIESIIFALYGKPYRDINKNQLINAINKKKLEVEIWFNIDNKHNYYIKRGIKPNIFEIHVDDVPMDMEAGTRDYQKLLETDILKMSYRTAKQVVALGTAGFTPFMQLKPHERRGVVEDLLDIEVFSKMSDNNKKIIDTIISSYDKNSTILEKVINELTIRKQHINAIKKDKTEQINALKDKIKNIKSKIDKTNNSNITHNENIDKLNKLLNDVSELSIVVEELLTIQNEIKNINKGIRFFKEHAKCPTCKQSIGTDFIEKKIKQYTEEVDQVKLKENSLITKQQDLLSKKKKNEKINEKIVSIKLLINNNNLHITNWNNEINSINQNINKISADSKAIDKSSVIELENEYNKLIKEKTQINDKKHCHSIVTLLLKDSGIKARIISQYIPIINQLINKFLLIMEGNYKFELDSEFNEVIKSRGREEFSYNNFSQGEKMRIDLAILFTWRELIRLKNGASFNILIMDEIMDSAADQDGVDSVMKIIHSLKDNVFIISHNDKIDSTMFDRHIKMIKKGNFAAIDEETEDE
jgi:DNA repair exonuclease SbcCD ATPase subunit